MARVITLKQRVRAIIRRYKRVNNHRFLYNKKSELKARFNRIKVWLLIHDAEKGYSIFPFEFKRRRMFSVQQWTRLWKDGIEDLQPLISIINQAILPAINNKGGNNWRFKALLCWTGVSFSAGKDELPKTKNTRKRKHRNKTTKARNGKPRHTNRRR